MRRELEAAREKLRASLGHEPSLADLAAHVRERTAGNPFFVEEILQSLVETGALEGTRGAYRLVRAIASVGVRTRT